MAIPCLFHAVSVYCTNVQWDYENIHVLCICDVGAYKKISKLCKFATMPLLI